MSKKLNIIKKPFKTSQFIGIDFDEDLELIGTENTDGIEDKIKDYMSKGYLLLYTVMGGVKMFYKTHDTDGLVRDIGAEPFSIKKHLYNYEESQAIWYSNIMKWYEYASEDVEFKAKINALTEPARTLQPKYGNKPFTKDIIWKYIFEARDWLANQEIGKRGSNGKRVSDVMKFTLNWLRKKVNEYVRRNKVWKKR